MLSEIANTLLMIGALSGFLGFFASFSRGKYGAASARLLATPRTEIPRAQGGSVEISGRVVQKDGARVIAPFSGREVVWVTVIVEQDKLWSDGYYAIFEETLACDFLVDDGSAELALVRPASANVVLEDRVVDTSGWFRPAQPHLEAYLRTKALTARGWLFHKKMRFHEQCIAAGDTVRAVGPSRRVEQGGLCLSASPTPGAEALVLSNLSEQGLVERVEMPRKFGVYSMLLGGVLLAIGLVLRVFSDG